MKSYQFNIQQLMAVSEGLGELLADVVFVGGCTTALLVDEAAFFGVRQTDDVDVIADIATHAEYYEFCEKLRAQGLQEDQSGVICRWLLKAEYSTVKVDIMPTDKSILGFSNRWYTEAIEQADSVSLPNGKEIRVLTPAYFMATKFEAFAGRGQGDYFSHDLEDIIFVIENRQGLIIELINANDTLKAYLALQVQGLLNDDFLNVLPGLLNNGDAAKQVENSLRIISGW